MKITLIGLVKISFLLLFTAASAEGVEENNINSNADKFVLNSAIHHFDNYYPRLANEISASALSAGIKGKLVTMHESVWLQATYSGDYTQFKLSENEFALDDTFSRYNIGLISRLFMGNRWYVDLLGDHQHIDYLLGTGVAKLRPVTPFGDSVDRNKVAASIVYGGGVNNSESRAARRFVKLEFSHQEQDYANRNSYSNLFDLEQNKVEFALSYKLTDITKFESSLQFEEVDFVDDSQLDNEVYRLLLGLDWQGTGQTHLRLLVGGYKRIYQSAEDNQGFLAELDAEYTPFDNVTFALKGSQTTTSGVLENALDTVIKSASIAIMYGYREHISFSVNALSIDTEYEQAEENQSSAETAISVVSRLSVNDHSSLSLTLQRESLEYDLLDLDYIQNKVELSCRYAF